MQIGSIVRLKKHCLGNSPGAVGVAVEKYEIAMFPGFVIIFENGAFDGFSKSEQEIWLEEIGIHGPTASYMFLNAMRLSADFDHELFLPAFETAKIMSG